MMTDQTADGYDDLVRLWQETALEVPAREDLSVRLARLTLLNFQFWAFFEDAIEHAGVLFVVAVCAVPWMVAGDWVPTVMAAASGLFIMFYFWRQRRGWTRLDPSADARTYHAALLERIDGRIRLYGAVPYWCVRVLPTYVPFVWIMVAGLLRDGGLQTNPLFSWIWFDASSEPVVSAALVVLVMTANFVFVCWLVQRWSLRDWRWYRAIVEAVYKDTR